MSKLLDGLGRLIRYPGGNAGPLQLAQARRLAAPEPVEVMVFREQLGRSGTGMAAYEIAEAGFVLCAPEVRSEQLARTIAYAMNAVLGLFPFPQRAIPKTLFGLFDSIEDFARSSEALGCSAFSPRTAGFWIPGVPPRILAAMTRSHGAGTVAHELTHAMLSSLRLPRWVDEGLATTAQSVLGRVHVMDPYRLAKILSGKEVRRRWLSGELFVDHDSERTHAAYTHAHRIVSTLLRLSPAAFSTEALEKCRRADAGARWLRNQFGLALDALFLD